MRMFSGTVQTWPLNIFRKGGVCKNSLDGDMHSHERRLVQMAKFIESEFLRTRKSEKDFTENLHWASILSSTQRVKLTYYGHILRSAGNTLDTGIIVGTTSGTERRRRAGRWIDDMEDWMALKINTAAERARDINREHQSFMSSTILRRMMIAWHNKTSGPTFRCLKTGYPMGIERPASAITLWIQILLFSTTLRWYDGRNGW